MTRDPQTLDPQTLGMQPHPEGGWYRETWRHDNPVAGFDYTLREGGQYLVRADEWQTARPATDEATLVACIVSPGFDFADFTLAH